MLQRLILLVLKTGQPTGKMEQTLFLAVMATVQVLLTQIMNYMILGMLYSSQASLHQMVPCLKIAGRTIQIALPNQRL
jgi:hypothetical protein